LISRTRKGAEEEGLLGASAFMKEYLSAHSLEMEKFIFLNMDSVGGGGKPLVRGAISVLCLQITLGLSSW